MSETSFPTSERRGEGIPFLKILDRAYEDDRVFWKLIHSFNEHVYSVLIRNGKVESLFHHQQCGTPSGNSPHEHNAHPAFWYEMIHDDDRQRVTDYFNALGPSEEKGFVEHRIVCEDGSVRWVANTCVVSWVEGDDTLRLDGYLQDITDRKRMEEELIRAKERAEAATSLKDNFVSMVAHDLRSPFAGILGLLQLVVDDRKTPLSERHKEMLRRVINSCQNQLDMINELLNITRINTGKLKPQCGFFPIPSLIDTVLQNQLSLAEGKGVRLEEKTFANISMYADQALVVEALNNLVNNAIKFTPMGGVVRVVATVTDTITVSVTDNGRGIPVEFADYLFRHDVKTTCPGTEGEVGTGLGLPYCADIMKAHGGALSFSPAPDGGSVFTLTLPIVKPEALVVEDDPVALDNIRIILERYGYGVRVAAEGEAAIRLINEAPPHLLITDLAMGGMDGYELIRHLRSSQSWTTMPVMVVTEKQSRDQILSDLGVDAFITKPVSPAEFLLHIKRFLGGGELVAA